MYTSELQRYHAQARTYVIILGILIGSHVATLPCSSENSNISRRSILPSICCNATMLKRELGKVWGIPKCRLWLQRYHAQARTRRSKSIRHSLCFVATLPCSSENWSIKVLRFFYLNSCNATMLKREHEEVNLYVIRCVSLQRYHAQARTCQHLDKFGSTLLLQRYHAQARTKATNTPLKPVGKLQRYHAQARTME